jgi:hypothetical protein
MVNVNVCMITWCTGSLVYNGFFVSRVPVSNEATVKQRLYVSRRSDQSSLPQTDEKARLIWLWGRVLDTQD